MEIKDLFIAAIKLLETGDRPLELSRLRGDLENKGLFQILDCLGDSSADIDILKNRLGELKDSTEARIKEYPVLGKLSDSLEGFIRCARKSSDIANFTKLQPAIVFYHTLDILIKALEVKTVIKEMTPKKI